MLPIYCLSPCTRCGHSRQGTRARKMTACSNCGVKRRVPVSRPLTGPDDPFAIKPEKGTPFRKGNPYRFTSKQEPDS